MRVASLKAVLLLTLATMAAAKDKRPTSDYTEGTLQAFRTVTGGMDCKSDGSLTCSSTNDSEYVVLVGDQKYTLSPDHTREFRSKDSVLYLQPAGTKVLFRIDTKKQRAYVLVGDRESKYYVVGIGQ